MISIRNKEEIRKIKEAGHINFLTHEFVKKLIAPGITTGEINYKADEFIKSHGGIPSFLNYEGYPASICISINDEVVHGIPGNRILEEGDIISIDIGVIKNGYHSDAARTYPVGKVSYEKERLIYHTEKMLYIGLEEIKAGARLNNIGASISSYAKKHNYGVIRELVGHGVGESLHENPDVPNYGKYNTGIVLQEGMVLAIEPMINAGTRHVCILDDDWTIVTRDGKPSAHFEHTVVVTKSGYEILTGE